MNTPQVMAINSRVDMNTRRCIKLFMQITYLSPEICEVVVQTSYRFIIFTVDLRYMPRIQNLLCG